MIVVDASAAVAALLGDGQSRRTLSEQQLHVPHLIDPEVASSLRRRVAARQIAADAGRNAVRTWQRLAVTRYPMAAMLDRVWELRGNVSASDACYVALAEGLDCPLVTADRRLAGAPGIRCSVTIIRS